MREIAYTRMEKGLQQNRRLLQPLSAVRPIFGTLSVAYAKVMRRRLRFHQSPVKRMTKRLVPVMPSQQQAPMRMGFPLDFTSLMMLVFKPMAAMATTIRNLINSFTGEKKLEKTPRLTAMVVMTEAAIK